MHAPDIYSINLGYSKGSTMYLTGALSRAYLQKSRASQVYQVRLARDKGGTFTSRITVYVTRVVLSLRRGVMQRLHYAQSGVITSLSQARKCIHWPGMSMLSSSSLRCVMFGEPDKKQAKVGIDQFSYRIHNLVYVDYYSSLWEVDHLEDTQSATVIQKLKGQLTRNGIKETCVSERVTINFR